ncbi:MAG: tRNA dihydrouridine(20/20a) synthase DusA, partial [Acidobacteriota bacterium]|nr:tRNA dihydrouridine(20/20a) synthase DusA [Acidobacteriota bacterium]
MTVAESRRGRAYPLSVAPMMDRTDRHYRRFVREITRRTLLYTEMITTGAVLQGDRDFLLGFSPEERPLALQLGGDDPEALSECARIAEDRGYDEVNLNVGCPSDRVRQGRFGACLMAEPERVADAVAAMREATSVPVTVKHRIGIDDLDRYEDMALFVRTVAGAGCDRFSVHARKAVLGGLSPKANRTVPPLRYEDVHRLKREHPGLRIEINGGIASLEEVRRQLEFVDGVMIGRAAYDDPFLLSTVDRDF